jgi:hypothetical protein
MPAPLPPSRTTSSTSTRPADEDEVPRPYVIVSHIGKGSFATVYKGYHEVRRVRPPHVRARAADDMHARRAGEPRDGGHQDDQARRALVQAAR